jgi:hypothetical protein
MKKVKVDDLYLLPLIINIYCIHADNAVHASTLLLMLSLIAFVVFHASTTNTTSRNDDGGVAYF